MSNQAVAGMPWGEIAASAYRAYAASTGNKNYQGLPMPAFNDLPRAIQVAWEAAIRQASICLETPAIAADYEQKWNGWLPPGEAK